MYIILTGSVYTCTCATSKISIPQVIDITWAQISHAALELYVTTVPINNRRV